MCTGRLRGGEDLYILSLLGCNEKKATSSFPVSWLRQSHLFGDVWVCMEG